MAQDIGHEGPRERVVVVASVAAEGAGLARGHGAPLLEAAQVDVARGALAETRGNQLARLGVLVVVGFEADAAAVLVDVEIWLGLARGGVEVQVDMVPTRVLLLWWWWWWGCGGQWRRRIPHVGGWVRWEQGLLVVKVVVMVVVVVVFSGVDVAVLARAPCATVVAVVVSSFM